MERERGSLCLISTKIGLSELCQKWRKLNGKDPADCGPCKGVWCFNMLELVGVKGFFLREYAGV